jgi:two-component system sensor histidine kinase RegB
VADNDDINTIAGLGRAQLRTLAFIRWVAIGGQSVTLLMVHYGLGFDLLLGPALLTVGASVLVNVFFIIRTARGGRRKSEVAALFAFDLIQLSVLLYLTGGLQNPFSFLLLAPVAVSAAILSRATVIFLSGLAIASVTVLSLWHMPLPWIGPIAPFPSLYVVGVWVSLAIGVLFFATYTYRVATESRQLSEALNATQMALAREQQVSAMGTLAAAAAHELGSPLGTIAVVAGEIAREIPEDSPHAEDIRLLVSETHRCRDILAALAQKPKVDTVAFSRVPISAVVEQSALLHKSEEIELSFDSCPRKGTKLREPMIRAAPEILHGLGNLIQNAIQFARKKVEIRVFWDDYSVQLNIQDDGSGFSQFVLDRIGEPYISSRHPSKGQMGLGIFIAQTLLERTGARLSFGNRQSGGAEICVNWKRELLDTGIHKKNLS